MNCELCAQLGRYNVQADIRATIPMAGELPAYWLCDDCAADLDAYVEIRVPR